MKNTYFDLIEQSYYFPQEGFDLRDDFLTFHGVSLKYLIEKHGQLRIMVIKVNIIFVIVQSAITFTML